MIKKLVTPWALFLAEREGYRLSYVFARKFFGITQYVRKYGLDREGLFAVAKVTFSLRKADYFCEDLFYEDLNQCKWVLREINRSRKTKVKLTKVN